MLYRKFRFVKRDYSAATAGLILTEDQFQGRTITELSRLFPMSESPKMQRLEVSEPYPSWDEAFQHSFDRD